MTKNRHYCYPSLFPVDSPSTASVFIDVPDFVSTDTTYRFSNFWWFKSDCPVNLTSNCSRDEHSAVVMA